jgi:hypothetical protein
MKMAWAAVKLQLEAAMRASPSDPLNPSDCLDPLDPSAHLDPLDVAFASDDDDQYDGEQLQLFADDQGDQDIGIMALQGKDHKQGIKTGDTRKKAAKKQQGKGYKVYLIEKGKAIVIFILKTAAEAAIRMIVGSVVARWLSDRYL